MHAGGEGPAVVPADAESQDDLHSNALQQRLAAAELERDKAKKQLNRCSTACSLYTQSVQILCNCCANCGNRGMLVTLRYSAVLCFLILSQLLI